VVLALLASSAPVRAQSEAEPQDDARDLGTLTLEDLLQIRVRVATKTELQAAATPAIVTVVTRDEIELRGYRSLAEVLRAVPGFYDVYDGVTHNIGVRGINGGQNASGNVLKLMIDGQPVDYRPTTGNFFGPELIPLAAVERIEIIRGPASALYGANAFLGVVNVITRSGASVNGARLTGQGALVRTHVGGGGGLVMGTALGPVDVLLGASYLYLDRSGLGLPKSSPILGVDTTGLAARAPSQNDLSQPISVIGKLSLGSVLWGRLTFLAAIQSLDAHGEYQSPAPLTHDTRITELNQNYRLSYEVTPIERLTLSASLHYFNGAPTPDSRQDIGRSDYLMLPSVAAKGGGFTVEGRVRAHRMLELTLGGDFVDEEHTLETFDQKLLRPVFGPDGTTVLRAAGTIIPGQNHGATRTFRNVGVFVQGLLRPTPQWTAVAGLRLDYHNIYGANVSARGGVVYARAALSLKLLYGSSFKAPSAEQLYAQPIGFGGIQGNPLLQAQRAHTIELAAGYQLPGQRGTISANVFASDVIGRVEFLPSGNFVQAQNIRDEWVLGGELDSRFRLTRSFHLRFSAGVARTVALSPGEGLLDKPLLSNSLFPAYQFHAIGDWSLPIPRVGLHLSAEVSYIGPREASFSNALIFGAPYEVGGYVYTALALATSELHLLPRRETHLALRISDVINYGWVEPGFGGVDVPSQGITVFLTLMQAL
jgi:outer membrane receptor protein involved in Fe transport